MDSGKDQTYPSSNKVKHDDSKSRLSAANGSKYTHTQGERTRIMVTKNSFSFCSFIMKLSTLLIILIAAGICYLATLDPVEQQICIEEMRDRAMSMTQKSKTAWSSTSNLSFSFLSTPKHVRIGTSLLKNRDPAGAESMCKIAAENKPLDIKAWICLGEARLALHNGAWMSGLVEHQGRLVFEKLKLARENFEVAVNMNQGATSAEARLGLGLSLFLTATRKGANGRQTGGESSSQLLFDSILHLNAAASLTSPSLPLRGGKSADDKAMVHMAAKYNSAIANLALGDLSSPIRLLQEVTAFLKESEVDGLSVPQTNLVAIAVQKGNYKKAVTQLASLRDKCVLQLDGSSEEQEMKIYKLCAIINNNIGIAKEAIGDDYEKNYSACIATEKYLDVRSGFGSTNYGEATHVTNENEGAFVAIDSILSTHGKLLASTGHTRNNKGIQSVHDAVLALEESATLYPNQPSLWILLAKAKLRIGDRVGAIEAGTKALNAATTKDDVEAANGILNEAITQSVEETDSLTARIAHLDSGASDVEALHLEREILRLKLQLLQHSLLESADRFQISHVLLPNHKTIVHSSLPDSEKNIDELQSFEEQKMKTRAKNTAKGSDLFHDRESENLLEQLSIDDHKSADIKDEYNVMEQPFTHTEQETNLEYQDSTTHRDTKNEVSNDPFVTERRIDNAEVESDDNLGDNIESDKHIVEGSIERNEDRGQDPSVHGQRADGNEFHSDDIAQVAVAADREVTEKANGGNKDVIVENTSYNNIVKRASNEAEMESLDETNLDNKSVIESEKSEETWMHNEEHVKVPELYKPDPVEIEEVPDAAQSYMKMGDAYLQKDNFKLAAKQFLKVLKKAPNHIPAILGYASSLERFANPKQKGDVAIAYSNVTRSALIQENAGLAQASFRRAIIVCRDMDENRIHILQELASIAFTYDLAADINYELGMELVKLDTGDARLALKSANEYSKLGSEDGNGFHAKSTLLLGKIALDVENDPKKGLILLKKALTSLDLGDMIVEALLYSARSKVAVDDFEGAIQDLRDAVNSEFSKSDTSAEAHHFLAVIMKTQNMDTAAIEKHMEASLNMGKELTPEALEVLGQHHLAVIKSAHKAEWKSYQEAAETNQGRGGIMSGGGISGSSSFSSSTDKSSEDDKEIAADALSMLEQGAAIYDGSSVPMGEESDGDSIMSINSQNQSRARANI
eukprot:scaffold269_cov245-Chaetoceros_neogracile.AAC.17